MKRYTFHTTDRIMFVLILLMMNKVFAPSIPQSNIQCDHEACIADGYHLNISK